MADLRLKSKSKPKPDRVLKGQKTWSKDTVDSSCSLGCTGNPGSSHTQGSQAQLFRSSGVQTEVENSLAAAS